MCVLQKYVFYFTLKALLVLLRFCPDFFDHVENGLIKKPRLISKFMTSKIGKQIIAIHILPNTLIAQYLKKQRQPDNEIWSVKGIKHEK